ncbi:MAG: hypothetical protein JKY37_00525 [Nannocystaceae bacterium]|nr:hypothetical protein [Nannocystaceae bacterium]
MLHNARLRLLVSVLSIASLGAACDLAAAPSNAGEDCQVSLDYKISCPNPDASVGLKTG